MGDGGMPNAVEDVARGRASYARRAWADAYEALARADHARPLEAADLELLSFSAGLAGHVAEMLAALERLHHESIREGRVLEAARAAFWVGFRLGAMGEQGRASGWFARAERLLDCEAGDCVVRGYLLLPEAHRLHAAGDDEGARQVAVRAVAIGRRFAEADLIAFAQSLEGRALVRLGCVAEGLARLDEAMVAATTGELSPLFTGVLYCAVIATCQQIYAVDRSREWTEALRRWCDGQPQLVAFTGSCLVHRSEVMQLGGAWREAIEEAERAARRFEGALDPEAVGDAHYQQGEIHRLRGERAEAEAAYEQASRFGRDPQPGLALLRLGDGQMDAAARAIQRALGATTPPLLRARLLPAFVEIMTARGALEEARGATVELGAIARRYPTDVLRALADHARGATLLAEGDAQAAIESLRRAFDTWRQLGAPYLAARIRVALSRACAELGDADGARLEREAARRVFEELGAHPDLRSLDTPSAAPSPGRAHGLTARELEVLRLVASGMTNRAMAKALFVSEKTIDRHVSNIYAKLDVSSRAAATAFAYQHGLV